MNDLIGFILISIGLVFDLLGCVGLVRLPDAYNRLQAATKCVTMGTCSILFGTLLVIGFTAAGMKVILCMIFLILTSPVASHAIARGSHKSGVKLWEGSVCDAYAEDNK
ncbi:MAG: Na+/H+ antiporter subunit G [Candidatus Omnitrophica bacterium CG07_land_8_20_14_0_80_42_15]|uniref:Na+/H+ antiporter subunit G n=1 Tax=Candidatus Aquitaenariimonas noxiae TaxID=1974741 RepID=A0A2J0L0V6_9BACT|nr:MAG: Na+/H+ antiporter subunit G [Candidatus Omnitrophica bacterium CG07_land_8_20_14_0_80_42_15]